MRCAQDGRAPTRHLGVVLPDDGPQDYEWHGLGPWLTARGAGDVRVSVAASVCDGRHVEASLFATGSLPRLAPAARRLAEAGCGAVVWACTSGSFIGGLAWAREQAAGLAAASGLPAGSTALALPAALGALRAEAVDLLSSYPAAVGERLIAFLAETGVGVERVRHLDCPHAVDSRALDLRAEVRAMTRAADARPLLIPDTAIDSLDLVDELEAIAGRPVVTANQASLWYGLRLLGALRPLPRCGRLFADAAVASAT